VKFSERKDLVRKDRDMGMVVRVWKMAGYGRNIPPEPGAAGITQ
jgi:hypothetical protein